VVAGTINTASNFMGWEIDQQATSGVPAFLLVNNFTSGNALEVLGSTGIGPGTPVNVIWTYSAATKTASDVTLFLNGTASGTTTGVSGLTASTASGLPLHVGSRADGSVPYDGSMSNLQIFSGVLTSGQIAAIQTAGP
jgi:Concanavalin A-like lectin/glucanases superfamily